MTAGINFDATDAEATAAAILEGRTALGIELGSTRIKACLVAADDPTTVLAVGSHEWENQFEGRVWTYSLEAVWSGLQAAYADLIADSARRHGVAPDTFGAIGVSAMMHGYLAFDEAGARSSRGLACRRRSRRESVHRDGWNGRPLCRPGPASSRRPLSSLPFQLLLRFNVSLSSSRRGLQGCRSPDLVNSFQSTRS